MSVPVSAKNTVQERERERERERDRERDRERQRETETERQRQRQTDRQTDRFVCFWWLSKRPDDMQLYIRDRFFPPQNCTYCHTEI